ALGNRVFLMNNVHDEQPVVMHVRWVMSYLRGPLTRAQIRRLMDPKRPRTDDDPAAETPAPVAALAPPAAAPSAPPSAGFTGRPSLSSRINEYFFPVNSPSATPMPVVYLPFVLCSAEVRFEDAAKGVDQKRRLTFLDP